MGLPALARGWLCARGSCWRGVRVHPCRVVCDCVGVNAVRCGWVCSGGCALGCAASIVRPTCGMRLTRVATQTTTFNLATMVRATMTTLDLDRKRALRAEGCCGSACGAPHTLPWRSSASWTRTWSTRRPRTRRGGRHTRGSMRGWRTRATLASSRFALVRCCCSWASCVRLARTRAPASATQSLCPCLILVSFTLCLDMFHKHILCWYLQDAQPHVRFESPSSSRSME